MHIKRNPGNTVADISTIPFGIYIMHFEELPQRENIFKVWRKKWKMGRQQTILTYWEKKIFKKGVITLQ